MKTPTQEFIDEVSKHSKELEVYLLEDSNLQKDLLFGVMQTLRDVESKLKYRYLEKEKDLIVASYYYGWHDGHNYIDTMPKTGFEPKPLYKDGEDFYNEKFNTKEI
jgi:hypothetical protein